MPKSGTFKCSFCGFPVAVPLSAAQAKCSHCGNVVTVPVELRIGSPFPVKFVLPVIFLVGIGIMGFALAFFMGLLPGTALTTATPRPTIVAPQFNVTQYYLDGNLDSANVFTQGHPFDNATSYYRITNGVYQGIINGPAGAPDGLQRPYLALSGDTPAFPDFLPGAWGTDFAMLIKSGHATFNNHFDADYDVLSNAYVSNFDDNFVNVFSASEVGKSVPTNIWAMRDDSPFHPAFMLNIEYVHLKGDQGARVPKNVFALYGLWTYPNDHPADHPVHGLSQGNSAPALLGVSHIPLEDNQWLNVRIVEVPAPNDHAQLYVWINGQLDQDLSRVVETVERVGVAAGTHYGPFAGQNYRGPLELDLKNIKLYQIVGDW